MKLCKDCRFFHPPEHCVRDDLVKHEEFVATSPPDYVNGGVRNLVFLPQPRYRAQDFREDEAKCGPEANWFRSR